MIWRIFVLDEFKTAEKNNKEILIFLRKDRNNKNLKQFITGIQEDYTYKSFSTLKEFELYLKKSIQYRLVHKFKILKDIDIEEKITEILTDENIIVEAYDKQWFEYELEEGDVIKGIVRELDDDFFNVYFMDEESFSDFLNDKEITYEGDEDILSYSFNENIEEDGTYYLAFNSNAILFDRNIHVKIKRIHYV